MPTYILDFANIQAADLPLVGGKGANLGEMARAGFPVPPGFCVTTAAFRRFLAEVDANWLYGRLESLDVADLDAVRQTGQAIRTYLQATAVPEEVATAVCAAWQAQGSKHAYAVRSSATAEDLPTASFAGQQDTYLNVVGQEALLQAVRNCWASLFTDRAILYRQQNGFDHREVLLSVVVQRMVQPQIAGILFTADPVSNHHGIASIDASYGLGEALVGGLVSADLYRVDQRTWQVVTAQIADKQIAIRPSPGGGTIQETIPDAQRRQRVLGDEQAVRLARLGVRVAAHYGRPQDIEWALADGELFLLQTRPITSLFPIPAPAPADGGLHLYFSFNHAQVMTDPMPAMSGSLWRLILPFGRPSDREYNAYMLPAGGRLYVDISPLLANHLGRQIIPRAFAFADPLSAGALPALIARDEVAQRPVTAVKTRAILRLILPVLAKALRLVWFEAPETAVADVNGLIDRYNRQAQAQLAAAPPGLARVQTAWELLSRVFPDHAMRLPAYIAAGIMARVLMERLTRSFADPADFTAVQRGLSGNVTTEMDLAVGDLADLARPWPELAALITWVNTGDALNQAADLPGGPEFLAGWRDFRQTYGMRGPGEIDISRPRWQDEPASLLRIVAGNLQTGEMGNHRRHQETLAAAGEAAAARLVQGARAGRLGPLRARLVGRLIRAVRHYLPVREHPKFMLIRLLGEVRQVLLETGAMLVDDGRLDRPEEVWHLGLDEVIAALQNPDEPLRPLVAGRQAALAHYRQLRPPRLITSDGEIPTVQYAGADLPPGALPGKAVSAGVIEGVARVVLDPATEVLAKGEILVAPFTDPGWTPLFINAAGLVMEVGGLMTHGSVVAREYGIPAVVGVLDATRLIQTGQRIRVQGDLGYVEILEA